MLGFSAGHDRGRVLYQASVLGQNQDSPGGQRVGAGPCLIYICFLADSGFPLPLHPSPCSRITRPCLDSQGADFWFPSGHYCPGPQSFWSGQQWES